MDSSGQIELAALGRAVRTVYVEEPSPDVAEAHIAAILAEAERVTAAAAIRGGGATTRPLGPRRRGALALRLAAVVASAFVASAGLAIAGVRPPEPFSDVFEGLGFDVPGSDDRSDDAGGARDEDSAASALPGSAADDTAATGNDTPESVGDGGAALGGQRSDPEAEASAGDNETAPSAAGDDTAPSEPGPDEHHGSQQTDTATLTSGDAGQHSVGHADGEATPAVDNSSGGEGPQGEPPSPPEPLIDPGAGGGQSAEAVEGGSEFGLAERDEHRPTVEETEDDSSTVPAS